MAVNGSCGFSTGRRNRIPGAKKARKRRESQA
jgi:hypothetical protein